MDTENNKNLPEIALISLFFIGNALINLPLKQGVGSALPGFFIAVIIAFPLISLLLKCRIRTESKTEKCFALIYIIYALFCGIIAFRNFVSFSDKIILPEISGFFPTILFLLLVWLICREKLKTLLKLSFICFVVIFFLIVLLFISNTQNMSFKALIDISHIKTTDTLFQALSYIGMSFIEAIVLMEIIKKPNKKKITYGLCWAIIILFIVLTEVILVFGFDTLSGLSYPYAATMSVITFGDKFSRMEGFSYFIYFACTLIKTCICIKGAKSVFSRLCPKVKRYFMPITLLLFAIIGTFTSLFVNLPYIYVAPFLVAPPIILAIFFSKRKA